MEKIPNALSMLSPLIDRLAEEGSVTFVVRAKPGAKKTEVTGVLSDGSVKVSVKSPPEDGKANGELVRFLADMFSVSVERVELLSGGTARHKRIRITVPR